MDISIEITLNPYSHANNEESNLITLDIEFTMGANITNKNKQPYIAQQLHGRHDFTHIVMQWCNIHCNDIAFLTIAWHNLQKSGINENLLCCLLQYCPVV